MERLTISGTKEVKTDVTIREVIYRLAEYEDLGLEPDEIRAYIKFAEEMNVCDLVRENSNLQKKIRFLEAQLNKLKYYREEEECLQSETVKLFLDFVDESRTLYSQSLEEMKREERRQLDYLHQIEFESNSKERNKICTKLHRSRRERRRYKDTVEVCEPIVRFFQDPQNKKTLDKMTQLLGEIRKVEKYHQNRSYRPRAPED